MRILIVEDEKRLSDTLKKGLVEAGFAVDQAFDGEEGNYLASSETYDLIVLDIMLPKIDGLVVCRNLRGQKITTPILMLTAKTMVEDKVAGLDTGADDYLTKPFSFLELKSRIQALLRRGSAKTLPVLNISDLNLDPAKHKVSRGKKEITLSPKEFAVLEMLMRHPGETVTRTMLTEHVWDYNFDGLSNVVDVYITILRRKIDKNARKKLIHTIHGVGYMISDTYD